MLPSPCETCPPRSSRGRNVPGPVSDSTFESYAAVLRQCGDRAEARELHKKLIATGKHKNLVLSNMVIQMYGRCGSIEDAQLAFDGMCERNVFTWTLLLAAYTRNELPDRALRVLKVMDNEGIKPNEVTIITVLSALAAGEDLSRAKAFHDRILHSEFRSGVRVKAALIHMFGKCKSPGDAREVFDDFEDHERNVVSWNSMIDAYAQNGESKEAFEIYQMMIENDGCQPTEVTFLNALGACISCEDLEAGRLVHSHISGTELEEDVKVGTAVVSMYGRCGSLDDAAAAFHSMHVKNVVSWNAIIAANAQNGEGRQALNLFWRMNVEGFKPSRSTLVSVLEACAVAGDLGQGKLIHTRLEEQGEMNLILRTSLLNMYSKCGSVNKARKVFDKMSERNVFTWNTLMAAYAKQGHHNKVLETCSLMMQEGVRPNPVTFVNVLHVCSHAGLVSLALQHFASIKHDFEIDLDLEHYSCVVDLLGRSGWLRDAEDVIHQMPLKDDAVWLAFLNGCKIHLDSERGAQAAGQVLNSDSSAPYVLLSGLS